MNNICIVGRLGHDVSLRYTADEMAVGRFSVAVGRGKNKEGKDLGTDWFECVAFGKQAEAIDKWFHKGDMIDITGTVRINKYTDKEGIDRKNFDVNVREFHFVDGGAKKTAPEQKTESDPVPGFRVAADEPPF